MQSGWTLVLLWALIALCLIPLVGLLLLPRFGVAVAFLTWAAMAAGTAYLVRTLFTTSRSTR
jgi:hypothetical protein